MTLTEIQTLARRLMSQHGLHDWTFDFDNAKCRQAACQHDVRKITLSRHAASQLPDEEIEQTLLHEIAHALVGPEHGHDAVWLAKARSIGYTGGRLAKVAIDVPRKWRAKCMDCGWWTPRHVRKKGLRHASCAMQRFGGIVIYVPNEEAAI